MLSNVQDSIYFNFQNTYLVVWYICLVLNFVTILCFYALAVIYSFELHDEIELMECSNLKPMCKPKTCMEATIY